MSTRIIVLLDRTGSMSTIKSDVIGGFNSFLAEQRKVIGTRITLIQFDSQNAQEVIYADLPVSEAPELSDATYVPRANTPLYDAIGQAIVNTSQKQSNERTIFAIITDGQENASHEYTAGRVRQMIEEKRRNDWQFVFLSADLDSFLQAQAMGIPLASSMAFDANSTGTQNAFRSFASNSVAYAAGHSNTMDWTVEQRAEQTNEAKRSGGQTS